MDHEPLPEHIADLIQEGRKIEAIQLIREETGAGLAEAKAAVDRIAAGLNATPAPKAIATNDVSSDVEAFARAGRKIEAIKALREQTGLGLKEAKERVEAIPGVPSAASPVIALTVAVALLILGVVFAVVFAAGG